MTALSQADFSWLLVFGEGFANNPQVESGLPIGYQIHQQHGGPGAHTIRLWCRPGDRRLSISRQPEYFSLFDGELFDQPELIAKLSVQGRGLSPADLIRLAYEMWDDGFIDHIHGSCTFILWDVSGDNFLAARDRLGRRSLFYSRTRSGIALSPSIETLLRSLNLSRNPNRAAIALTLSDLSASPRETYFEDIFRLEPGHLLQLDRGEEKNIKYWEPAPPGTPDDQMKEADLEEFDSLFEQAVYRLTSIGRTGIFLSGGLDSVSITAVAKDLAAQKNISDPLALSIAFPDPQSNEETRQRSVAEQLGLDHVILPFSDAAGEDGLIWSALKISAILDTPLQNPWLPVYLTLAIEGQRRGCEVILTGAGGDEWMAVNPAYMSDLLRDLKLYEAARFMRSLLKSYNLPRSAMFRFALWTSGIRPVLGLTARQIFSRTLPKKVSAFRYDRHMSRHTAQLPEWLAADSSLQLILQQRIADMVEIELQKPELERPYGFYNTTSISANFDRAVISMEQEEENQLGRCLGITYGHPFWDSELVRFLCRIPPRLLIVDGREKSVVRKSIARRFPDLGFEKQKKVMASGFYFSNLVKGGQVALERLGGLQKLEDLGIIKQSESDQVFRELITSPVYRKAFLAWELINFEVWLRSHR